MKKYLYVLLAALSTAGTGQAQVVSSQSPIPSATSSYAGVIMGLTRARDGCELFDEEFDPSEKCDDNGRLTKIYGGTHIGSRWFIEAALINFGKFSASYIDDSNNTISFNDSARAVAVSLAYRHALNQRLLLSTRVGLAYMQQRAKATATNNNGVILLSEELNENKLRPVIGFGAELRLYENISAVVSADYSMVKSDGVSTRIDAYGLGISMDFDN
jgi:Outer membrane protein beta-barrel domain